MLRIVSIASAHRRLSLRCGFAYSDRAQPAAQIETRLLRSFREGFLLGTSKPQTDGIFLTVGLGLSSQLLFHAYNVGPIDRHVNLLTVYRQYAYNRDTDKETTMDARQQRGLEIAATMSLEKQADGTWSVPSQSLNGRYSVNPKAKDCTCRDFELRQQPCKHIFAVDFALKREIVTDGKRTTVTETTSVRVTYAQNWPAYNAAQTAEKELFCHLLRDLCAAVPEPGQIKGRPRIPMADALFSACFKVYSTASSRRFMTDLREACANGLVARPWHFNTVLKVIDDKTIAPTLHRLIAASAAPLKSVESAFAVDSTGFGTQSFYRHYTAKYGHEQYSRNYIKLHALIGTKTNVIAAATITDRDGHDSPQFKPLIEAGAETFEMAEVSADKAYSSRDNVALVESAGAAPFIPFRSNSTVKASKKAPAWDRLFHLYNFKRDEFMVHYHARSNAESTFSSMKRVFGDTLRSKGIDAQTNELLLKVIAYNIVCVVHSIFELGVTVPSLSACTQKALAAHNVSCQ